METVRRGPDARVALAFLAIVGIPTWLAVDLAAAMLSGWWTSSSIPGALFGVCGAIIAVGMALLALRRGRRFLARRWAGLVALVLSLALSWTMAEVVVGKVFGSTLLFHRHVPGSVAVFQPTPEVMPGVRDDANYTTNSMGMRGTEVPAAGEAYRVLCIGGSTTACLFLDDTETWPAIVQAECQGAGESPMWVGDVGKSGYGSWHHVKFLSADEVFSRVDCVLLLVGINDFMRALQGRRIHSSFGAEPVYERSSVHALVHNLYQASKERRQHREEFRDGSSYVERRRQRAEAVPADELPDLTASLEEYRGNLRTIIEACRARGLRVVFMTQPVLWTTGLSEEAKKLLWLGLPGDGTALTVDALVEGMARFNGALRQLCSASGVECIDVTSMNGKPEYFFDDCHFSELGARRVGKLAADFLKARGW